MITLLLSFEEGADFLNAHFLRQLAVALERFHHAHTHPADAADQASKTEAASKSPGEQLGRLSRGISLDDDQPPSAQRSASSADRGLFSGRHFFRSNKAADPKVTFAAHSDSDDDVREPTSHSPPFLGGSGTGARSGRRGSALGAANSAASSGLIEAIRSLPAGPSATYDPSKFLDEASIALLMGSEYLSIIGLLSAHARGRRLLRHHGVWDVLNLLCQLPDRADLASLLLTSVCYSPPTLGFEPLLQAHVGGGAGGEPGDDDDDDLSMARSLLGMCCDHMQVGDSEVRLAAVSHLYVMAVAEPPFFEQWGLELLRNTLFDDEERVRRTGLAALLRASEHAAALARIINMYAVGALPSELLCRDGPIHERQSDLELPLNSPTVSPSRRSSRSFDASSLRSPSRSSFAAPPSEVTSTRVSTTRTPLPQVSSVSTSSVVREAPPSASASASASPAAAPASHPRVASKSMPSSTPPPDAWRVSAGYTLLLRILSTTEGFEALSDSGWLADEMEGWRVRGQNAHGAAGGAAASACSSPRRLPTRLDAAQSCTPSEASVAQTEASESEALNDAYAAAHAEVVLGMQLKAESYTLGVEALISEAILDEPLAGAGSSSNDGESPPVVSGVGSLQDTDAVVLPPHLFGALASTDRGRSYLMRSCELHAHIAILRNEDASDLSRRAAVWAAAHVGASEGGFRWLVSAPVCPTFVHLLTNLATSSASLSLRGTAVYALGLLGGSGTLARDQLLSRGWSSPGVPTAFIALPTEGTTFLSIEEASVADRKSAVAREPKVAAAEEDETPFHTQLMARLTETWAVGSEGNEATSDKPAAKQEVPAAADPAAIAGVCGAFTHAEGSGKEKTAERSRPTRLVTACDGAAPGPATAKDSLGDGGGKGEVDESVDPLKHLQRQLLELNLTNLRAKAAAQVSRPAQTHAHAPQARTPFASFAGLAIADASGASFSAANPQTTLNADSPAGA